MINCEEFCNKLLQKFDFYTGVPDSLLKSLCAYITANVPESDHIIAANEGGAVALASGHYLATGKPAVVYMQNSGIGNALNPLVSLNDPLVYGISALLLVGWRGEPGFKDEPQHAKQGLITTDLFDTMGIRWRILPDTLEEALTALDEAEDYMREHSAPYALVVRKDSFSKYSVESKSTESSELSREEAIKAIVQKLPDAFIVSTTGMISRELFETREQNGQSHDTDFLTVGSMGHCSQIALGVALAKKDKHIVCFDGDGAALMHMGAMAIIAERSPENFIHIVFNNSAHDSVGGQPTIAGKINLSGIAGTMGYKHVLKIEGHSGLENIDYSLKQRGPVFIEVMVRKGARADLGRPTESPAQCKTAFCRKLGQ